MDEAATVYGGIYGRTCGRQRWAERIHRLSGMDSETAIDAMAV